MKYNSIGEQLIAKAQELDPNYKPDKFNDMSEALDVILNKTGSEGGDIWLDITPYLHEDTMSISQEGYDLVYNSFSFEAENPINKYIGISIMGNKFVFNRLVESDISDKKSFDFIFNIIIDGVKAYVKVSINNDKSVEMIDEIDSSNQVWFDLGTISETITQDQYNEIKSLIDNKCLAGITVDIAEITTFAFPLMGINYGNTFVFGSTTVGTETDVYTKKSIDYITYTIKPDLSCKLDWNTNYFISISSDINERVIPTITQGHQENLSIGEGLKVEGNVLKTNNIPELPSDASTKTYVLKAVNGVLTWSE